MTSESTESGSAQRDVYTGSLHDPNAPKDDDSSPLPANFAASEALESSGVTSSEPSNIPETIPTQITTATYLNSSAVGSTHPLQVLIMEAETSMERLLGIRAKGR